MKLLLFAATAASLGPGPNGLSRTPPMGWMSWQRFRCETNCTKEPDACINEALYNTTADAIAAGGAVASPDGRLGGAAECTRVGLGEGAVTAA